MAWQLSQVRKNDNSIFAFRHRGMDYYWNPARSNNLQWLKWRNNGKVKVAEMYLNTHWELCILETSYKLKVPSLIIKPYGGNE